jgi:hypothetical protein
MPTTTINLKFNFNTSLSACKQRPTIFPHELCTEDVTERSSFFDRVQKCDSVSDRGIPEVRNAGLQFCITYCYVSKKWKRSLMQKY